MDTETWNCRQLSVALADGTRVSGAGSIIAEPTGKVEVSLGLPGMRHLDEFADAQDITGDTVDGFDVLASGAYPTNARSDSATMTTAIQFTPLECTLTRRGSNPATWDKRDVYLKSAQIIGACKFDHAGAHFTLRGIANQDDRRAGLVRSVLTIESGGLTVDHVNVLLLLSLAQRCLIQSPMQKSFSGDDLVSVRLVPNELPYVASHPLIPRTPRELASYFAQTLPNFAARDPNYQLNRLIQYYCLSVTEPYGEIKFILASVLMEAFKFYWALNVGQKPPVLKANGLVRGFQRGTNAQGKPVMYSFEELLAEACAHIGYNANFTFIEDRNAMFHTGAPGAHQRGATSTWSAIKPELVTLYRQIDDILLTILGYRGPIHRWDTSDHQESFP